MATILIKRGLQANVESLVLQVGEMAVATDTGNVYIGTTAGKVHVNPKGGTADEAVKLQAARKIGNANFDGTADITLAQIGALAASGTAAAATKLAAGRTFAISGDGTAPAVTFDGTGNVALALTLANSGVTAGTYTKLTVDAKGRVTGATNITVSDVSGLGTAASKSTGKAAGNVVIVESDGKIDASLIPSMAITDVFESANETAMLALSAQQGDICIRSDENKSYILKATPASTLANWVLLRTPANAVLSVAGKTGAVTLTKSDVGLGNVDNTADSAKNVASAAKLTTGRKIGNATFDGTADITLASIGAAGTAVATTSANGLMSSGDKTKLDGVATGANNYTHPDSGVTEGTYTSVTVNKQGHITAGSAQTTITGNAGTATTLQTARTIALSGGVTGTATSFNGSANITIPVTAVDSSKLTGTIDGGTF